MQNNWLKKVNFVLALAVMLCAFGVRYYQSHNTSELTRKNTFAENRQEVVAEAELSIPLMAAAEIQDEIGEPKVSFKYEGSALEFNIELKESVVIDWGDGNTQSIKTGKVSHKYAVPETYEVQIKEDKVYFLNVSDVRGIKELVLNGCNALEFIDCANTEINKLDLTACENLKYLVCNNTNISELDLTGSPELEYLYYGEGIKSIKINELCKTGLKLSGSSKTEIEYGKPGIKPEVKEPLCGDINEDGILDGRDLLVLARYVEDNTTPVTEQGLKNADVNLDGKVNGTDREIVSRVNGGYNITLPAKGIIVYGDVNEDGILDGRDLLRLGNYLADKTTSITAQGLKNADFNGDGKVDQIDLTSLEAHLATQTDGTLLFEPGKTVEPQITDVAGKRLADVVKAGDYVVYQPTATTYSVPSVDSNYSNEKQTFNPSEATSWRVLSNDSTNGLQLITKDSVGDLILSGNVGFNNLVKTLNELNKAFENTTYTESRPALGATSSSVQSNSEGTYYNQASSTNIHDTYYTSDVELMKTAGVGVIGESYWLASRQHDRSTATKYWYGRIITEAGELSGSPLHVATERYSSAGRTATNGFRAVVKLKNDVVVLGGKGTAEEPYEIVTGIEEKIVAGDVNEDGIVDGRDLLILAKYVGKLDVQVTEQGLKNADVNLDGKVDDMDVELLSKKISGYDIELNGDIAYGDVNEDGVLNGKDLLRLAKYIGGNTTEITEQGLKNADVNLDSKVDNIDLELLCQKIGGYDITFPVQSGECSVTIRLEDAGLEFADGTKEKVLTGSIGEQVIIPEIKNQIDEEFALYILDGSGEIVDTLKQKVEVSYKNNGELVKADELRFTQGAYEVTAYVVAWFDLPESLPGKEECETMYYRNNTTYQGGSELPIAESFLSCEAYIILNGQYQNYYMDASKYPVIEETYVVTYDANGGVNAPASQQKKTGETVILAGAIEREGYNFLGWSVNPNSEIAEFLPGVEYTADANITLYAVWGLGEEIIYTISYNSNGGLVNPAAQTKKAGETVILAGAIEREGYNFLGWTSNLAIGEVAFLAGGEYGIDANITLYAVWESAIEEPVKIRDFIDVEEDAWYYDIVTTTDYLEGTTSMTFSPDDPLTREMFIAALYNVAGNPSVSGSSNFPDVYEGSWSEDAIVWATKNNLVSGNDEGRFKPSENITRQEAIVVLKKYAEYAGYSTEKRADLDRFADTNLAANEIYDWAVDAMSWAVAEGIISGNNQNKLGARENLTRAQMVSIFNNLLKVLN